MAVYKVPQDVEAEDKLIGPFGFRQFIYLMIAAFGCFIAFLMYKISPFLVAVPLPVVFFFLMIALPLRKDQPTEVYLAAVIQYNLKAKKRLWIADGAVSTVTITAPKEMEDKRTKDLSEDEAVQRLSSLAQLMDTRGWAARGVTNPQVNSTGNIQFSDEIIAEAANAPDILDADAKNAQALDSLITEQENIKRKEVMDHLAQAKLGVAATQATPTESIAVEAPKPAEDSGITLPSTVSYQPYPQMHQHVLQPTSIQQKAKPEPQPPETTSEIVPSPDTIELAKTPFSVATIAKEKHRREAKKHQEEVEIKLH
jgi:hypothetical protein